MDSVQSTTNDSRQLPRQIALVSGPPQVDLLKRARGGDIAAFEDLVSRTKVRLHRVAMRYMRNECDAQDVLQNAFLSAWGNLPTFEGRAQFGSWMHRIVVNSSLMRLRSRDRHPEVAIDDLRPAEFQEAISVTATLCETWLDRPDGQLQSAELRRHIETAVDLLPRKLKEIFLLRDVREMSTGDCAVRLGVTIAAARTRLHRARKVLRASLADYLAC